MGSVSRSVCESFLCLGSHSEVEADDSVDVSRTQRQALQVIVDENLQILSVVQLVHKQLRKPETRSQSVRHSLQPTKPCGQHILFTVTYMVSDIWLRTILIVRKETRCRHICYSFRLTAMVLLYAPSHKQDSTYHGLCYTSRGALAGTRNSSMKDWSDDPSHHERTLLPRSYISLPLQPTIPAVYADHQLLLFIICDIAQTWHIQTRDPDHMINFLIWPTDNAEYLPVWSLSHEYHVIYIIQSHEYHVIYIIQSHEYHVIYIIQSHEYHVIYIIQSHEYHVIYIIQSHEYHVIYIIQSHEYHVIYSRMNIML